MKKKIMILGASILQLPAIEIAKKIGLQPVVIDMNSEAVGFKVEGVIKEVISTIDTPAIVEAAKRNKIDGIMTLATDMPIRSVAAVAKEMRLVGIDEKTAIKATNKVEMRKALQEHNVPIPQFFKVSNIEEYYKAVKRLNAPFIVKPADGSGSRGIFKVQNILNEKLIENAYEYCYPHSSNGDVIVEEYMSGPEVSVETISINGICHVIQITDKLTTGTPHFVEIGHSQPTQLKEKMRKKVENIAKAANKAVGIKNGPSHTEIIITDTGPKIVELGARLGGDNITTHLVPLSTGVNMVEACIRIAIGEKPDIEPKWNKGSAIRYFKQVAGVVNRIEGIKEAEHTEGIQCVTIVHGVGNEITEIIDSGSRMGFVIAQSDSVKEAIRVCENALEKLDIKVNENELNALNGVSV